MIFNNRNYKMSKQYYDLDNIITGKQTTVVMKLSPPDSGRTGAQSSTQTKKHFLKHRNRRLKVPFRVRSSTELKQNSSCFTFYHYDYQDFFFRVSRISESNLTSSEGAGAGAAASSAAFFLSSFSWIFFMGTTTAK